MEKVLHYVSSMDRGGEETFIMNVFRDIDRQRVNFGFLYTAPQIGAYGPEIDKLGGKIHHLKLNRLNNKMLKHIDNYVLLKNKLKQLSSKYDYFHIHTQHAMDAYISSLAAYHAGFDIKKIIVHSHNSSTIYNVMTHRLFKKMLHRLSITRFACGNDAGQWMFGADEFTIIHNGIDLSKFYFRSNIRKEVRKELGWTDKHVIGNIGRFNVQKNQLFLIKTFYEYSKIDKNALLVLIGSGELKDQLIQLREKLNLRNRVQILDSRSDVNRIYQGLDLFVLPSLFEGLPVVLVEAQTSDLPCIISDNITDEIDLLPTIHRLSLRDELNLWSMTYKKILYGRFSRNDTRNVISKAGYDIRDVAKYLQDFYLKEN